MRRVIEIALITFKQALKERGFYVILITTLLAMIGMPVLYGFTMFEIPRMLSGFALSYTNLAVLLLMLILIMNILQTDLDRKTLQYVISLPIRRSDYILGRFLGFSAFGFFLTYFILLVLAPLVVIISKQRPDAPLYMGYYFLYGLFLNVELAVLIAFALLFLSITSRTVVSLFAVAGTYLIGHTVDEVAEFLKTRMGENITIFSRLIVQVAQYFFPNLSLFDLKTNFVYGVNIKPGVLLLALFYGLLYSFFILALAVILFNRKEIY